MFQLSIFLLFIPVIAVSQVSISATPKVKSATGGIISEDISENPAKASRFNNQINTYYAPNIFGLSELSPANLDALYSFGEYSHYIKVNGIESQKFDNIVITSTSSYSLTDNLNVGVNLSYHTLNIDRFNSYNKLSIDIGALLEMTENLSFGISVSNLTNNSFRDDNSLLSRFSLFGFKYKLSKDFSFDMSAEVRSDINPSMNLGVSKSFSDFIMFRIAYSTFPGNFDATLKLLPLDYLNIYSRLNYNSDLGFTNTIGLAYLF